MSTLDFAHKVELTLSALDESDVHPENRENLKRYARDLSLDGKSKATIQKRLAHLKVLTERLGPETSYQDLDLEDCKDLMEWVENRDVADSTKGGYQKAFKFFMKWLKPQDRPDDYPKEVDWINPRSTTNNSTLPKDLLTLDDVDLLIETVRNTRDKALIAVLWETGARIGEVMDLTVGDVEDRKRGRKIVVDGKTGARRIPLIEAVPHINRWLSDHPNPQKDAPLWCKLSNGESGLSYNYIRQKILQKTADKAEIEKPVNPHHFRHSRASYLANRFTEAQLCEWFGWVQGSDIPAKYVHLSGRDIDNAFDQLHGFKEEDEEEEDRVKQCPRCKEMERPDASFCNNCGWAFDENALAELEEDQEKVVKTASEEEKELVWGILGVEDEAKKQVLEEILFD